MLKGILAVIACATVTSACGGHLNVAPIGTSNGNTSGIPVYLQQHQFLVSIKDRDAEGRENPDLVPVYELVEISRRDAARGFVISNSSPVFASTTFSVVRGETGALISVQSDQTDRTLETIQAIASFIPVIPGIGLAGEEEEAELAVHLEAKRELLEALKGAKSGAEIAVLEEALAKVQARIDALNAVKAAAGQKKKGVTATGSEAAMVEVVTSVREVDDALEASKAKLLDERVAGPQFLVILAPVEPDVGRADGSD